MKELHKVTKRDLPTCSRVLAEAFAHYPMYRYVLGDQLNLETIEITTRFFSTYAYRYAQLYASSPEIEGVIGAVDYHTYRITPWRFLRCNGFGVMRLGSAIGRRFSDYDRIATDIHNASVSEPHQYIMFLGVRPASQGQGLASRLLRPVLELAAQKGQPTYLETHDQRNVAIYQRFGFRLVSEHQLPDSEIVLYAMLRPVGGR